MKKNAKKSDEKSGLVVVFYSRDRKYESNHQLWYSDKKYLSKKHL